MKILIVYPEYQKKSWSLYSSLKLASKKQLLPPREVLRVSILLPITWEKKYVDLNQEKLGKKDLEWADYVFIRAGEKQFKSTVKIIERCKNFKKRIVAIGSLFTENVEEFENVEHLVLDDIRVTLPLLVNDLENAKEIKIYHSNPFFEIRRFTEPYYAFRNISENLSQNIQLTHA